MFFQRASPLSGLAAFEKVLGGSARMPALLQSRKEDDWKPTFPTNIQPKLPYSYFVSPLSAALVNLAWNDIRLSWSDKLP